jgi:hypothetical protein
MGRAVFQLQAGMLNQLLGREAVVAPQHPFQFQGHGFGQRRGWIKRSRARPLAMPLCTDLLGTAWIAAHGLLPQGAVNAKARTMQDSHGSQC